MAGFVPPEAQNSSTSEPVSAKKQGFIPPEAQSSGLFDAVKQGAKAALFPLLAPAAPIASASKEATQPAPPVVDPEQSVNGTFPNIQSYPAQGVTSLGPTLDVFSAPFIAKDVAKLGVKGGEALLENFGKKAALKEFVKSGEALKNIAPQGELALEGGTDVTKPVMKLEQLRTARLEPSGEIISGHNTSEIVKKQLEFRKADAEKHLQAFKDFTANAKIGDTFNLGDGNKATFIGKSNGVPELGIPEHPLFDLSGENLPAKYTPKGELKHTVTASTIENENLLHAPTSPEAKSFLETEIKKKGFVDKQGNFIPPEAAMEKLTGQGTEALPAFARELPFPSTKSGVAPEATIPPVNPIQFSGADIAEINKKTGLSLPTPPVEQPLPLGKIEKASTTQPFQIQERFSRALPEGAEQRINQFAMFKAPDIDPNNPLTSRVEMNKKLGTLKDVATEQSDKGFKASMVARQNAIDLKTGSKQIMDIKPDSLEDKALDVYIQTPVKGQAYSDLVQSQGKEFADKIKAKDAYNRKVLNELLPKLNKVRAENGLDPIAYKENYMPHMTEVNVLEKLGLIDSVGTKEGQDIVNSIVRANTDPIYSRLKDVVFNHVKHQGTEYNVGPTEAFERYVDSANNYIHMQPYVNELNASAEAVKASMPNLSIYLKDQADYLAGKVNPIDRTVRNIVGDGFIKGALELQRNAIKNVIQGSPKVAATQVFGTLPTITKYPMRDVITAAARQVMDPELRAFAYEHSSVLKDRGLDLLERNLHAGPISKQLNNFTAFADYEIANHNWITAFVNATRKGLSVDDAIKQAEESTALFQGFTSKVNTPPLMRSQVVQGLMPLQNQQLAYARSLMKHAWEGKSIPEKSVAATKLAISGGALGVLMNEAFGTRGESPLNPTNWIPFGGVLQRGMGGPVMTSASNFVNAKTTESKAKALIQAIFLMQSKIPAGNLVGKVVTESIFGKPKRGKQ